MMRLWAFCLVVLLGLGGFAYAEDTQQSIDDARVAALKDLKTHYDVGAFASKDPQFEAHMTALQDDSDPNVYMGPSDIYLVEMNQGTTALEYNIDDGSLVQVQVSTPDGVWPGYVYVYDYPSGNLAGVTYAADSSHMYAFKTDGTLQRRQEDGHCYYADGSSCDDAGN